MRARRRRSVMNTISAAVLEVAIMGLFVIIAQPQLRDALFEIMQVEQVPTATTQASMHRSPAASPSPSPSFIGLAIDNLSERTTALQAAVPTSQFSPLQSTMVTLPSTSPDSLTVPAQSGPNAPSLTNDWRDRAPIGHTVGYSPLEQFESIRIAVPANNQANTPPQYAMPQYVPPQTYAQSSPYAASSTQHSSHAGNYAPTQLAANQWNIASAAQSRSYAPYHSSVGTPAVNNSSNANNWIPSQVTETSFRQPYPPPYGTQSMWK